MVGNRPKIRRWIWKTWNSHLGNEQLDKFIVAFLGKLGAGKWADKLIDFVSKGSLSSLADALSVVTLFASGINVDAVYFTEV